ncbi:hypothetical protein MMC18_006985 [Xylographa bjoerkii]|nr:hypothetical protein [Xylographa bjoerkii]
MAAQIPRSTILVIAASGGGFVLLLLVLAAVYAIVKCQRRRRLTSNRAARDKRLSRYPGGHLSLTPSEADRNRPPKSLRQLASTRSPYGFWEGWKNVGSRDSLSRRSVMSGTSRSTALSISYPDLQLTGSGVPRLPPAARVRHYASGSLKLSPITERRCRDNRENCSRSQDRMRDMVDSSEYTLSTHDMRISAKREDQYGAHSQAKPYVRTHRRSTLAGPFQKIQDALPANGLGQPLEDEIRSTMTRTFSLHSQRSGHAPIVRMDSPPPELPREIPRWSRVQALRSHPKDPGIRPSTVNSISSSSSLYDDDVFGSPFRSEANLGSVGLPLESNKGLPHESDEEIEFWNVHETQTPNATITSNSFELARIKPRLRQPESHGSGVERHPLSRNPSSGLAPSLVDQYVPSRSGSDASRLDMFNKDMFNISNIHRLLPLGTGNDSSTITPTSTQPGSPDSRLPHVNLRKESPLRASMSVLQDTSGNKSSLYGGMTVRPSSDPTTQPFIWDEGVEMKPGKPSVFKGRSQGHKRQSRQRVSLTATRPSSIAFEATVEELADNDNTPSQAPSPPDLFLTSPQQERSSPRPPSIATFEVRLKPPSTPSRGRQRDPGDYSKVVSVYESYNMERGASSEDLLSTPTRKPSSERPYDRRSKILPGTPSHPLWLLREPFIQKVPEPTFADSLQLPFSNDTSLTSNVQRVPKEHPNLESHAREDRIAKGSRVGLTKRSPIRRSPSRGSLMHSAGRSPTRPLALAVTNQLRKKNSEILDSDAKYYMNMGAVDILPGTPELEDLERLELVTPKRSLPKVYKFGDSGQKPIDMAWREINRRTELVGLGITAGYEQSDHMITPETLYNQVNHLNGGT